MHTNGQPKGPVKNMLNNNMTSQLIKYCSLKIGIVQITAFGFPLNFRDQKDELILKVLEHRVYSIIHNKL